MLPVQESHSAQSLLDDVQESHSLSKGSLGSEAQGAGNTKKIVKIVESLATLGITAVAIALIIGLAHANVPALVKMTLPMAAMGLGMMAMPKIIHKIDPSKDPSKDINKVYTTIALTLGITVTALSLTVGLGFFNAHPLVTTAFPLGVMGVGIALMPAAVKGIHKEKGSKIFEKNDKIKRDALLTLAITAVAIALIVGLGHSHAPELAQMTLPVAVMGGSLALMPWKDDLTTAARNALKSLMKHDWTTDIWKYGLKQEFLQENEALGASRMSSKAHDLRLATSTEDVSSEKLSAKEPDTK